MEFTRNLPNGPGRTYQKNAKSSPKYAQLPPVYALYARVFYSYTQKKTFWRIFFTVYYKTYELACIILSRNVCCAHYEFAIDKKKLWLLWKNGPRVPFPFSLSLKWLSTFFNWHQSSYTYMVQKTRSQKGRRILLEVYIIFWTSPAEHQPTREKNKLFLLMGGIIVEKIVNFWNGPPLFVVIYITVVIVIFIVMSSVIVSSLRCYMSYLPCKNKS